MGCKKTAHGVAQAAVSLSCSWPKAINLGGPGAEHPVIVSSPPIAVMLRRERCRKAAARESAGEYRPHRNVRNEAKLRENGACGKTHDIKYRRFRDRAECAKQSQSVDGRADGKCWSERKL